MFKSIKSRITLLMVVLLFLAVASTGIITLIQEKNELLRERKLRGSSIVRNLSIQAAEARLKDDNLRLNDLIVDIINNEDGVKSVRVLDQQGRVLAANNPKTVKMMLPPKSKRLLNKSVVQHAGYYKFTAPIQLLGKKIGYSQIDLSSRTIDTIITKARNYIISIGAAIIIIGIILAWLVVKYLLNPLNQLVMGAKIIGTGRFDYNIRIKSKNEIGDLAESFNQMTGALHKRQTDITRLNESARDLSTLFDKAEVLEKGKKTIQDIISPDKLLVFEKVKSNYLLRQFDGFSDSDAKRLKIISDEDSLLGEFATSQESLYMPYLSESYSESTMSHFLTGPVLLIPMFSDNEILGLLLLSNDQGNELMNTDKEYAEIISSALAVSLQNINLLADTVDKTRMEQELKTAELVQETLFPKSFPKGGSFDLSAYFESATETGGDWYGFFEDPERDAIHCFIGDVTGHGVPSALITSTANSYINTLKALRENLYHLRNFSLQVLSKSKGIKIHPSILKLFQANPLSPKNSLEVLNKIIEGSTTKDFFMTFFAATYYKKSRRLVYSNAGHEMPLVVSPGNGSATLKTLTSSGVRLGQDPNAKFTEHEIQLEIGDTVIWYTDGIIEGENPGNVEYSEKKFYRSLKKHISLDLDAYKEAIMKDAKEFYGSEPLKDDITLLMGRVR